jgi:hypothetical protein
MIIDDDCPVCRMFGDETSPLGMGVGFWHLDESNMDDEFAFSSFKTRQEWEVDTRRREEFHREFDRKWAEREQRIARGEPAEPDPFFDPEPWDLKTTLIGERVYFESGELDPPGAQETYLSESDDSDNTDCN